MALISNSLKGLNNWLETSVKTLEQELENSINDFETLELIYKSFSCECDSSFCKNCESLENKNHYLVKSVDKLSKGKSNFENVLAPQTCVFEKSRLGFNPQSKNNGISKLFSTIAVKQSVENLKQLIVPFFYCIRKGHFDRFCKVRKVLVPRGILKWVPKNLKGSYCYNYMP